MNVGLNSTPVLVLVLEEGPDLVRSEAEWVVALGLEGELSRRQAAHVEGAGDSGVGADGEAGGGASAPWVVRCAVKGSASSTTSALEWLTRR